MKNKLILELQLFFIAAAKYHIDNATELIKLKANNLALYGMVYKKSFNYAVLNLSEKLNFLMFNFFSYFIKSDLE